MSRFQGWSATTFASLQWLFFIFANTIVVPISVGTAFDLPAQDVAGILRSSLIFTGLACFLQGWIGHRFPLMEGHSGVIWGLVLNLSFSAHALGMGLTEIGGGIASGMLLAGSFIVIMAAFNSLGFMERIFNPMVMSVFLLLLTFQLIKIFFEGMFAFHSDGTLDLPVSMYSIVIFIFVCLLRIKGKPMIGNFSILIGMLAGWIFYLILFPGSGAPAAISGSFQIPIFPYGLPNLNFSIILTTFIAMMVNLSNTVASVKTAARMFQQRLTAARLNRSYTLTGLYGIAAAIFGLVSYAPYASSIGFLESTRIFERKPFLISGIMMAVLGIIPALGSILATLPITVGNAVLFAAYVQLFGTFLKSLRDFSFNSITIHRLAIPGLVGLSIIHMDPALFTALPTLLQPILSNGFIVGILLSVVLEFSINWDKMSVTNLMGRR